MEAQQSLLYSKNQRNDKTQEIIRHNNQSIIIYIHALLISIVLCCEALPLGYIHTTHGVTFIIVLDIFSMLLFRDLFDIKTLSTLSRDALVTKQNAIQWYLWTLYVIKIGLWLFLTSEVVKILLIDCCTLLSLNLYIINFTTASLIIVSTYELIIVHV